HDEPRERDERDHEDDERDRASEVDDEAHDAVDGGLRREALLARGVQEHAERQADRGDDDRRAHHHEDGLERRLPKAVVEDGVVPEQLVGCGADHRASSSSSSAAASTRRASSPVKTSTRTPASRRAPAIRAPSAASAAEKRIRPTWLPWIVSTVPAATRAGRPLAPRIRNTSPASASPASSASTSVSVPSNVDGGSATSAFESAESPSAMTSSRSPERATRPSSSSVTESQISRTTDISCVMMSTVMPRRSRSERMSSRIWRVVAWSRADVGSSQSSTRGSAASARAMPTRCFWPPESCDG